MFNKELDPEDFYYSPEGYIIFTEKYHLKRGYCCKNGCKHCPYDPQYKHGNQNVQEKYLVTKEEIDIFKLKKGYAKTRKRNSQ